MTLDEIYDKFQREKKEKQKLQEDQEQLINDNYNQFRNFMKYESRQYSQVTKSNSAGGTRNVGIGRMVVEKSNRVI